MTTDTIPYSLPITAGDGAAFPILNATTPTFSSNANYTASQQELAAILHIVRSSVPLTVTRTVFYPLVTGLLFLVVNVTTGGQSIQILGSSGTGVVVPNGSSSWVYCDGANWIATASQGGSGGSTGATDASTLTYTPAASNAWDPAPTEVASALDQLAGRNTLSFIFQPGGTAGGNVYTDMTSLSSAMSGTRGATLVFDLSFSGGFYIAPAGTLNFGRDTVFTTSVRGGGISFQNETTLAHPPAVIRGALGFLLQQNTDLITSGDTGGFISIEGDSFIYVNSGSGSFLRITDAASFWYLELKDGANIQGISGTPVITAPAPGSGFSLTVTLQDSSLLGRYSVDNFGGGYIYVDGTAVNVHADYLSDLTNNLVVRGLYTGQSSNEIVGAGAHSGNIHTGLTYLRAAHSLYAFNSGTDSWIKIAGPEYAVNAFGLMYAPSVPIRWGGTTNESVGEALDYLAYRIASGGGSGGGGITPDASDVTFTPATGSQWSPIPTKVGPALDQLMSKNDAYEIPYGPNTPGDWSPTPGNIGDALDQLVAGGSGAADASALTYTPTSPGDWTTPPTTVAPALDSLAASIASLSGGGGGGPVDFLAVGTNPAATGSLRIPNGNTPNGVYARSTGNDYDLALIYVDPSNQVQIGDSGNVSLVMTTAGAVWMQTGGALFLQDIYGSNNGIYFVGTSAGVPSYMAFGAGQLSPTIYQEDLGADDGVGQLFTLRAQNAIGQRSTGGEFRIQAGSGLANPGAVTLYAGATKLGQFAGLSTDSFQIGDSTGVHITPTGITVNGVALGSGGGGGGGGGTYESLDPWLAASTPVYAQADNIDDGATGALTLIRSQKATGATSTGGELRLQSETGTGANGALTLYAGDGQYASIAGGFNDFIAIGAPPPTDPGVNCVAGVGALRLPGSPSSASPIGAIVSRRYQYDLDVQLLKYDYSQDSVQIGEPGAGNIHMLMAASLSIAGAGTMHVAMNGFNYRDSEYGTVSWSLAGNSTSSMEQLFTTTDTATIRHADVVDDSWQGKLFLIRASSATGPGATLGSELRLQSGSGETTGPLTLYAGTTPMVQLAGGAADVINVGPTSGGTTGVQITPTGVTVNGVALGGGGGGPVDSFDVTYDPATPGDWGTYPPSDAGDALDAVAGLVSTLSQNLGAIVYRPSGTSAGKVVATLTEVQALAAAMSGPTIIYFDNSALPPTGGLVPVPLDVGTWTFSSKRQEWISLSSLGGVAYLNMPPGGTFNTPEVLVLRDIYIRAAHGVGNQWQYGTPSTYLGHVIELRGSSTLDAGGGGGKYVVQMASDSHLTIRVYDDSKVTGEFGFGGQPAVDNTAGGELNIELFDHTVLDDRILVTSVVAYSPSVSVDPFYFPKLRIACGYFFAPYGSMTPGDANYIDPTTNVGVTLILGADRYISNGQAWFFQPRIGMGTFVFQPGGNPDPRVGSNVFTDENSIESAVGQFQGSVEVYFDAQYAGGDTYTLVQSLYIIKKLTGVYNLNSSAWPTLVLNASMGIEATEISGIHVVLSGGSMRGFPGLKLLGSSSVVSTVTGQENTQGPLIEMYDQTVFGDGTTECIYHNQTGGNHTFRMYGSSVLAANSVIVDPLYGSHLLVEIYSPTVSVDPSYYPNTVIKTHYIDTSGTATTTIPPAGSPGALLSSAGHLYLSTGSAWTQII